MTKKTRISATTAKSLDQIEKEFSEYAESIDKLLTFDEYVLEAALRHFDGAIETLERGGLTQNPAFNKLKIGRRLLVNIKEDASLRSSYQAIYNQIVVIWVSVLAATLESLFKYLIAKNYPRIPPKKKDRKIKIGDLQLFENVKEAFGDIVLKADAEISFQDIGSIKRTFEEYFGIHFNNNDLHLHNVAFAIRARHAIVHNAGRIDMGFQKYANQELSKRTVMKDLSGTSLQFGLEEAKQLSNSFRTFVTNLLSKIRKEEVIKQKEGEDIPF